MKIILEVNSVFDSDKVVDNLQDLSMNKKTITLKIRGQDIEARFVKPTTDMVQNWGAVGNNKIRYELVTIAKEPNLKAGRAEHVFHEYDPGN